MNEKITASAIAETKSNKSNELNRVVNGIPVVLRFSDTANRQVTELVQDIMLNSLGKKAFSKYRKEVRTPKAAFAEQMY